MQLSVLSSAALPPRSSRGSDSPLYLLDDRSILIHEDALQKKKRTGFMCCTAPSTVDVDSPDAWVNLTIIEVHSSERLRLHISVDGTHRSDYSSLQSSAASTTGKCDHHHDDHTPLTLLDDTQMRPPLAPMQHGGRGRTCMPPLPRPPSSLLLRVK